MGSRGLGHYLKRLKMRNDASERLEKASVRRTRDVVIGGIKELALIIAVALLLSFLIKTFLFRAFYIPSGSMEDTLQIGDRVFVNLLVPEPMSLKHGDIVVFKDSQGWLGNSVAQPGPIENMFIALGIAPDNSSEHLIKRVIGLPGDRVVCCTSQGAVSVNDQPIAEPYLPSDAQHGSGHDSPKFDAVVPAGKVWVMGDNRNNSRDSRFHQDSLGKGFVPLEDIVGKATVIAWPINHWTVLDSFSDTFTGPASK